MKSRTHSDDECDRRVSNGIQSYGTRTTRRPRLVPIFIPTFVDAGLGPDLAGHTVDYFQVVSVKLLMVIFVTRIWSFITSNSTLSTGRDMVSVRCELVRTDCACNYAAAIKTSDWVVQHCSLKTEAGTGTKWAEG